MSAESLAVLAVVVATGALGAVAVLGRMAMERHRLLVRYDHIKTVMAYEEQLRAKKQKASSSVARPAAFLPDGQNGAAAAGTGQGGD